MAVNETDLLRYALHTSPRGDLIRFDHLTGKAWRLIYGDGTSDSDRWEPIKETELAQLAELAKGEGA